MPTVMFAASVLSNRELFWWGALGGAIATVVVYLLPGVIQLATGETVNVTVGRVVGIILLLVILSALGGAGPFLANKPTTSGDAIKLGIGALAAIRAILASAQDAAK